MIEKVYKKDKVKVFKKSSCLNPLWETWRLGNCSFKNRSINPLNAETSGEVWSERSSFYLTLNNS